MSHTRRLSLVASVGFAALLCGASPSLAQIALGTAGSFGVLAGSAVTNTGATAITGDLGISPNGLSSVTGFTFSTSPGPGTVTGTTHFADAVAIQAKVDLVTAYDAITTTPTVIDLTGTDLGGLTLIPGVYAFSTSAQLTGTLTLNAQGNPAAIFIFKIGSTLTTASGSSVAFINTGGNSHLGCNVFWQIGTSATLGTTTAFAGNILAMASITLNTGATVDGRLLARNGAVTLQGNTIVSTCAVPAPPACPIIALNPTTLPNGVVGTPYSQTLTASGGATPYTILLSSGALPPGLTLTTSTPTTALLSGNPTTAGTFIFTITATDANGCFIIQPYTILIAASATCPPITLNPLAPPPGFVGRPYSQTVTASGGTAPYRYTLTSGALPPGLTLTLAGVLSGTPTTLGPFNFTITATDANECTGLLAYTVVIAAAPAAIPTLSEWGVILFMGFVGLMAMYYLRRKRREA